MNRREVAVVDYGVGNLLSVRRGLEHCGATVTLTGLADELKSASKVVLPGVGDFSTGMAELRHRGLESALKELALRGVPLLGICLGMQMLLDESEESGVTAGLGLISGRVIPVPAKTSSGQAQKIPHIGWGPLVLPSHRANWEGTLLDKAAQGESMYFVHSFMACPERPENRIADCLYGGVAIAAVVARDNVHGCQFHPEKSGEAGLSLLRRFLEL